MAEDPKPLTEAQIKQRDELNAQAAAYEAAQAEKARQSKADSLVNAAALAKLLTDAKIITAFDTAVNDPNLDFETKSRIQSMRVTLNYNVDQINAAVAAVTAPTPTGGTTA